MSLRDSALHAGGGFRRPRVQPKAAGRAASAPTTSNFPKLPTPAGCPPWNLFLADGREHGAGRLHPAPPEFLCRRRDASPPPTTGCRSPKASINRAYATLGLRMVRDALARESRLYAMGMGGWDKPLPQMLKRLRLEDVRGPVPLQSGPPRAIPAPHTRSPYQPAAPRRARRGRLHRRGLAGHESVRPDAPACRPTRVDLGAQLRTVGRRSLGALARGLRAARPRDAATLDQLYPPSDPRFLRVRAVGGWAVLLDTQMRDHKQFGDMRVGTIVDCLAPPESAGASSCAPPPACWSSAASI